MSTFCGHADQTWGRSFFIVRDGQPFNPREPENPFPDIPCLIPWGHDEKTMRHLAKTLLRIVTTESEAQQWYGLLYVEVIAQLPTKWVLSSEQLQNWLQGVRQMKGALVDLAETEDAEPMPDIEEPL